MAMRAIIVDDEEPARELLRVLLGAWETVEIVGEAADGDEALRLISAVSPDLVFLDVQMPHRTGFDVLAALPPDALPFVVFVTAFDQYALKAFEVSAFDYLLKPFDAARLAGTMRRVLDMGDRTEQMVLTRAAKLLSHLRTPRDNTIVVKTDGRHLFLRTSDVEWIEAVGKEVRVHMAKSLLTVRESMNSLESRLDPTRFVRVQRSAIINREFVREMQPWFKGDYVIIMRSGARVVSGRTYRGMVQRLLSGGVDIG